MRAGTIIRFNEERGFGFIAPEAGTGDLFFHVSAISGNRRNIAPGETIQFDLGVDKNGRIHATRVLRAPGRLAGMGVSSAILTPLITILGLVVIVRLAGASWWVFAPYALMSIFSFGAYKADKDRSIQGQRRTPEAELHMLDLLGGWPGGMFARTRLRHKSRKLSFRLRAAAIISIHFVFWTVIAVRYPNLFGLGTLWR